MQRCGYKLALACEGRRRLNRLVPSPFTRALSMPPRSLPTLLLLGCLTLTACATQPKADASYERFMQLAADLEKRGDSTTAASFYQRATQQPEAGVEAWRKLGAALLVSDDTRGAERAYQRALELKADDPEALLGLGTAQLRQGKLQRAVNVLNQAATALQQPQAWNRLGIAYILSGEAAQAQNAFNTSLRLAPNDLDTRCNLALAYALGDNNQKALDTIGSVSESPLAQPRHQRNQLLVMVLAGKDKDLKAVTFDDIPKAERSKLIAEARRIKAIPDRAEQARELGLVDAR
ncbi:TPR domain-containing protein [Pseudomonas coronafaciens pv. zizaniae]|uniref:TPR domain-containing protein n=3 Tax=Pseudomonas syringae group TaxID=136849 RepID=A0AB37QRY6_9PSED|nr:TPR domain-containing protein [Pseudomonas coronafaciens pv. oryzae]KPZ25345.1 TPR domain-containing protein [Pseudomonas coronafaciens pv. zizaniae]RMS01687.1 TPR domain-containing protein [Pseudomonas coronafaciens pv. garcae]RMM30836.1 TPR domain-containing protein [Pseudomonas coronafaciens pv. oryzae]RMN35597.1 TPR domain-containing protein [Pseudomonas coronafaciens pv. zizaniae]